MEDRIQMLKVKTGILLGMCRRGETYKRELNGQKRGQMRGFIFILLLYFNMAHACWLETIGTALVIRSSKVMSEGDKPSPLSQIRQN